MKKLIIALAIIALAAPAMADVDLYGSARMWTFVDDKTGAETAPGSDQSDDTDTLWVLGPFSRFGATFKNGDVGGKVEMDWRSGEFNSRVAGGGASSLGDARIRHIYGTWNFGSGELLVGQTWPLTDLIISGLGRSGGGLQPYGGLGADIARVPQIRLTFGGLAVGFLQPWTLNSPDDPSGTFPPGFTDVDTTLPKIEASYKLPLGDHQLTFAGGYQSYDLEDNTANTSESIDAYVAALQGKFNFGAFYLNAIAKYAINPGPYGAWQGTGISGNPGWDGSSLQDYTLYGGALVLGFKVNDMITIEGGYGMNKGEWDISGGTFEQDNSAYYVNVPITLAPGVRIVPEFAKFDYGTTEVGSFQPELEDGEQTSIGAVWYISF